MFEKGGYIKAVIDQQKFEPKRFNRVISKCAFQKVQLLCFGRAPFVCSYAIPGQLLFYITPFLIKEQNEKKLNLQKS